MKTPALRALLGGSVDYAGLFPPAALALEPALDNYATYLRSEEAWMLGCFVLPVAKLPAAGPLLAGRYDAEKPLRVSALGSRAETADEFLDGLRAGLRALADFQQVHGAAVQIEQLEAPLPTNAAPGPALGSLLRETTNVIAEVRGSLRVFLEVPFCDDLPALLHSFAEHRSLGVKLRTGGLEASAFPSSAQLAEALVAARDATVLKFTAGLHHPFRRFDAEITTQMHGFVNVFVAGVFCYCRSDEAQVRMILEDEDLANFSFEPDGFRWRDRRVHAREAAEARKFITSFGSCSFDEPRDDLRAVGLLP